MEFIEFSRLLDNLRLNNKWSTKQKEMLDNTHTAFIALYEAAEQRLHLTAIAACGLGVLIGLGIGWFWFGA